MFYCIIHKQMEDEKELFATLSFICDSSIPQTIKGAYGICYASAKDILGKDIKEIKDSEIIATVEKEKVKKVKEIK